MENPNYNIVFVSEKCPFQFIKSQKGYIQLKTNDGYVYVKEKAIQEKVYWRCTAYTRTIQCHARAHTINTNIVRRTAHNHLPFTKTYKYKINIKQ